MDRATVTQRVWELVEPLAESAGLELVDVQYRPEGGRVILRLLLDRLDGGVTLDELAAMSRQLGDVLDAHDAVQGRYHLECSSPGVNRPLVRPEHFARAVGQLVRIRTHDLVGGRRQFRGTLEAVESGSVSVRDPDAGVVTFPLAAIERASTEFEFPRPARPGHAHA
jgi:ribosome maturation factor RimP